MKIYKGLVLIIFLLLSGIESNGQCKRLAKGCASELGPFVYNGQVNKTLMTEGESAVLMMSFQGETEYRIQTCADKFFGEVKFEIFDTEENLIYSNEDDGYSSSWDFELTSAQNLLIKVTVPIAETGSSDFAYRGCIAVLIGLESI